jgi:hypothetical protein
VLVQKQGIYFNLWHFIGKNDDEPGWILGLFRNDWRNPGGNTSRFAVYHGLPPFHLMAIYGYFVIKL